MVKNNVFISISKQMRFLQVKMRKVIYDNEIIQYLNLITNSVVNKILCKQDHDNGLTMKNGVIFTTS